MLKSIDDSNHIRGKLVISIIMQVYFFEWWGSFLIFKCIIEHLVIYAKPLIEFILSFLMIKNTNANRKKLQYF